MDTFRILMVLPSVFTRGWNPRRPILTQKSAPGGGVRKPLFRGSGGPPPPPPGGGEGGVPPPRGGQPRPPGGTPLPPPGGGTPPSPGGGKTPAKKDPPLGYPKFMHKFMTQIREGNYER